MKGLVVIGAVVALTAVAPDLWASTVISSPQFSAGPQTLLLEGPVESIDEKNGTSVVLGQKLSVRLPDGVVVGDAVSILRTWSESWRADGHDSTSARVSRARESWWC